MSDDRPNVERVELGEVSLWTVTEGAGKPLVLCHGGPGLWDDLGPAADMVSDLVRVHRYDQRGGGRSTDAPPHTVASFVQDLESLRKHWGYEQWTVGGHSWGASLALAYAATYPHRIDSVLYLSGTGLGWTWHAEYEQAVARRLGPARQSQLAALKKKRSSYPMGSDAFAETDRAICRIQWSTDCSDSSRASDLVESLIDERFVPNYDLNEKVTEDWKRVSVTRVFQEAVKQVESPVLIVHGSDDPRPVSAVRDLADSLPNCRIAEIDGAGHFPWLESTNAFRSAVRPFLSK